LHDDTTTNKIEDFFSDFSSLIQEKHQQKRYCRRRFFFPPIVGKDGASVHQPTAIFLCSLDPVKEEESSRSPIGLVVLLSTFFFTVSWRENLVGKKEFSVYLVVLVCCWTFIFPTLLTAAHGGDGASTTDILPPRYNDTIVTWSPWSTPRPPPLEDGKKLKLKVHVVHSRPDPTDPNERTTGRPPAISQ